MLPDTNSQKGAESRAAWRLDYMRMNAKLHALICLGVLAASFLVAVPHPTFLISGAALGVFIFSTWTIESLRSKLIWMVPIAIGGGVWIAVAYGPAPSSTISFVQFLCITLGAKSLCFWVERRFFNRHVPGGGKP